MLLVYERFSPSISLTWKKSIMAEKVENWTCEELGKLGIDASIDIARYILSIETAEELEEYMLELIDGSDPRNKKFIKELLIKWRPYNSAKTDINIQVYQKTDQDDSYITGKEKKKSYNIPKEKKTAQKSYVLNGYEVQHRGILPGEEPPEQPMPVPSKLQQTEKDVKKKQKFVPLFSKEGQDLSVVQLAGRHVCECQAAKHKLVNNCTRCGRVVCDQEGSGPCLYCGNLVCSTEEEEILSRGSKKSEKLRQHLMKDVPSAFIGGSMFNGDRDYLPNDRAKVKEGCARAEKHKDKLLEYDRTSVRRTQVIDDEADYFSTDSNQWLSEKERGLLRIREEELRSQRHASRKDRKITFDFAGRQVIEEDPSKSVNMYDVNDEIVQRVNFGARPKQKNSVEVNGKGVSSEKDQYLVNPQIQIDAPKFIPQVPSKPSDMLSKNKESTVRVSSRIQDRQLQEMSDDGMCMSMHQPWASLLTVGIKIHEGRTWYTAHRGRLWIAATAKAPDPAEIAEVEHMYKTVYKNRDLQFPGHYPVGCLLGCVDVVDCLSQDTYQEQFPNGESGSPFVFICENPQELIVKFPVKGKHKIYKIDTHIHKAAKKGLR